MVQVEILTVVDKLDFGEKMRCKILRKILYRKMLRKKSPLVKHLATHLVKHLATHLVARYINRCPLSTSFHST